MKNNKGQITLFVVAGFMLLLLLVLMITIRFYFASENAREQVQQTTQLPADIRNVESFIRRCIQSVGRDGLLLLGKQGGYIAIPEIIKKDSTAYWHLDKVNIQPTIYQTRAALEEYMDAELAKCLDFSAFEQEQNIKVTSEKPKSVVSFDTDRVSLRVLLPIDIVREDFLTHYDKFDETFSVQWRRLYELATQINMRQLNVQFKFSSPLELVEQKNEQQTLDMNYVISEDSIFYTVSDKIQLENGQPFSLTFASRLLNSDLQRIVQLQNNSRTVPNVLPYIVYSVDQKAQLYIVPGTTAALHERDVSDITITQTYPNNVSREGVPTHEDADNYIKTENISWVLTYPMYHFDPTGLRFNRPQRLVLYWDEDRIPHQGNMGILYDEGEGWRPLPSSANYEQNYIYTDIPGFSSYTPVDCSYQPQKEITVISELEPGGSCVAKLVLIIVIIIILIIVTILTFGAASPATVAAGGGVASGSTVAATTGTVAVAVPATAGTTITAAGAGVSFTAAGAAIPTAVTAGASVVVPAGATITIGAGSAATFGAVGAGTALTATSAAAAVTSAGLTGALLSSSTVGALTSGGFLSGAGALFTSASGLILVGFVVSGSIVGGAYINSAQAYSSPEEDTIVFTPTCDQTIYVHEDTSGGSGMCIPEGAVGLTGPEYQTKNNRTRLVKAGIPQAVKAVTKKCSGSRRFFCQGCTTQCKTTFV